MKLAAYLNREQISPSAFAETLGVAPSTITRLIKGEREPGLKLALAIRDKTGGDVSPDDLVLGDAAAFPPSVALSPAPPSVLPDISPARGEIGSSGAGDDRPTLGDDRPALGDDRPTVGDLLPTADCRLPDAAAAHAIAEAAG